MDDFFGGFILGILVTFIFMLIIGAAVTSDFDKYEELLQTCPAEQVRVTEDKDEDKDNLIFYCENYQVVEEEAE